MHKQVAAVIGGGVIGGGWAARFALNGWDVQIFDPDPQAERKVGEVMANARRSLPGMVDVALPSEGTLTFHDSIAAAVDGAVWIQESVPEQLAIKHTTLAEIQKSCLPDAVIGSSTSGFKPSELQEGATRPEQIIVAHPFNPVYLLPLIEVVPTRANTPAFLDGADTILKSMGFYPLRVRKEIDAHIADRFLEAVWREALWLVKAGMKHFMAQFGPALKWPWTKLMDVPEFTDELVDLIAGQSDEQSGAYSIRELERIRDTNLVAMMRALKAQDWGAGALMNAHEATLRAGAPLGARVDDLDDVSAPLLTVHRAVPLDWTDYNGHMNEAKYLQAFCDATDRFMEMIGCDADYISAGGSYFTAETHIRHVNEALAGTVIDVRTQVLSGAGKKLHLFHEMYAGEHFLLHVSLETRRPSDPAPHILAALERVATAHAALDAPAGMGRAVGQRP